MHASLVSQPLAFVPQQDFPAQTGEIPAQLPAIAAEPTAMSPQSTHSQSHGLQLQRFSDLEPRPVEWLWPARVPLGKLTLLVGDPGLGKSLVTIDWAARVSRGAPWPDCPAHAPQGSAIMLSAEDDAADTVHARLLAADADLRHVATVTAARDAVGGTSPRALSLARDLDVLDDLISLLPDCRLVVIDPISAYLQGIDGNRNDGVRGVLGPLSELAARRRVAVVAVTHLNKRNERSVMYRALGSLAFVAQARTVWGVARDPHDERRRLLTPVKTNITADTGTLLFRLPEANTQQTPSVCWELPARGWMPHQSPGQTLRFDIKAQEYQDTENHCLSCLRDELADGPKNRKYLFPQGDFSDSQLRCAADRLGVIKVKPGFVEGWVWMLPEHYENFEQLRVKTEKRQKVLQRKARAKQEAQLARARARREARKLAQQQQPSREERDLQLAEFENHADPNVRKVAALLRGLEECVE